MKELSIGFIGGGNMALAICEGLVRSDPAGVTIAISEPNAEQRRRLKRRLPDVRIHAGNEAACDGTGVVILAVKPQILKSVCIDLAAVIGPSPPLFVSIAAGVRSDDIKRWLGGHATIIRTMPNQPALLGQGMTVLASNGASADQRAIATKILDAVGATLWVDDEAMIDSATAISGSGPAYFFLVMEIMIEKAIEFGYSQADARQLVTMTATGAAAIAAHEADTIATLRERVTSPGGTTAAALEALAAGDIRAIFQAALTAARDRSRELADEAGKDRG